MYVVKYKTKTRSFDIITGTRWQCNNYIDCMTSLDAYTLDSVTMDHNMNPVYTVNNDSGVFYLEDITNGGL